MKHPTSRVQRELKQQRPFRTRRQEALVGLLLTAEVLRRALAGVIEPHGITLQQYNVLRILRGAEPEGLPTLEVAARMIERTPGITRLLGRIERKGLVQRHRPPSDRREVRCRISTSGLRLLGGVDPLVLRADQTCLGALEDAEVEGLIQTLETILDATG